jgi:prepilin-type N-terminal cleavage/methylation domain-containing protein
MRVRRGTTLIETLVVLALIGIVSGIAWPRLARTAAHAHLHSATAAVISTLGRGRALAMTRRRIVAVTIDSARAAVTVASDADTLVDLLLRSEYGVTISATRDSIAFGPTGRGYGAANTTIVIARDDAADTILVSRLGRWKRAAD